jgi:hypothetical protein
LLGARPWFGDSQPPPAIALLPHTNYADFLASDQGVFRVAPQHYLVDPPEWAAASVNPGWAASMNLQLITGFDAFNFRHYQRYMDLLQANALQESDARVWTELIYVERADLLDGLNVKYVLTFCKPEQGPPAAASFPDEPILVVHHGIVNRVPAALLARGVGHQCFGGHYCDRARRLRTRKAAVWTHTKRLVCGNMNAQARSRRGGMPRFAN